MKPKINKDKRTKLHEIYFGKWKRKKSKKEKQSRRKEEEEPPSTTVDMNAFSHGRCTQVYLLYVCTSTFVDELDPFFNGRQCLNCFPLQKSAPRLRNPQNSQKKQKSGSQGGGSEDRSQGVKQDGVQLGGGVEKKEEAKQSKLVAAPKRYMYMHLYLHTYIYIRALTPTHPHFFFNICNIKQHPWDRRRGKGDQKRESYVRKREIQSDFGSNVYMLSPCKCNSVDMQLRYMTAQTIQKVWPGCSSTDTAPVRADEPLAFLFHTRGIPQRDTTARYDRNAATLCEDTE